MNKHLKQLLFSLVVLVALLCCFSFYAEIYAKVGTEEYACEINVQDEPINLNQIEKTYYDTGMIVSTKSLLSLHRINLFEFCILIIYSFVWNKHRSQLRSVLVDKTKCP